MKNFLRKLLLLCPLVIVIAVCLTGCASKPNSNEFSTFTEGLNNAIASAEISQSIEVKDGALVVYTLEKSYKKGEDGYTVTGEEKKLNSLESSQAYTTTPISYTVKAADTFTTALTLSEEYFTSYRAEGDNFSADLKDESVDAVLGLEGSHAQMKNVVLKMSLKDGNLSKLQINFVSGSYEAEIILNFVY